MQAHEDGRRGRCVFCRQAARASQAQVGPFPAGTFSGSGRGGEATSASLASVLSAMAEQPVVSEVLSPPSFQR